MNAVRSHRCCSMDSIILVRIYRAKTIDGMMLLNDVFDLTVVPNMNDILCQYICMLTYCQVRNFVVLYDPRHPQNID